MNQLADNAPILSNSVGQHDTLMKIAATELLERKLNVNIKRPLPRNTFYTINAGQLRLPLDVRVLLDTFKTPA